MVQQPEQASMTLTFGQIALIALGSNVTSQIGDSATILRQATDLLQQKAGYGGVLSPIYKTPCFPPGTGPDYANAVLAVRTDRSANQILTLLHATEADFGRQRTKRWGQRTLDLDLLALGDQVAPDLATYETWRDLAPDRQQSEAPVQLILPHPRLQDRAFVLVPMADVAPDWVHPVSGLSVRDMLAALPASDRDGVVRVG
jgi:2-amino-4-hydroxy-6-hydroxymethyldihydropteridine diphosphokinase